MLSPITTRQFERLRGRYSAATLTELSSGAALVCIPHFALPAGWSATSTTIWFIVPVGYPGPCPDCFWADAQLRLQSGTAPQASNVANPIPETGINALWFSWHVTDGQRNWNPNRDELLTFAGIVYDRFRHTQ